MGKLFIGGVEPVSLGAIDKLYVGSELVWPSAPAVIYESHPPLTRISLAGIGVVFGQNNAFGSTNNDTNGVYEWIDFGGPPFAGPYNNPPTWNTGLPNDAGSYELAGTTVGGAVPTSGWRSPVFTGILNMILLAYGNADVYVRESVSQVVVKRLRFSP